MKLPKMGLIEESDKHSISSLVVGEWKIVLRKDIAEEIFRRVEAYNPWIPVSEIAPGLGVWVLVSDTTMIAKGKRIDKTSWFGPEITTIFEKQITHWKSIVLPEQVLPKPSEKTNERTDDITNKD